MLRIKDLEQAPPGGYWFVDIPTGTKFKAWTFSNLVQQVRAFRKANNRPSSGIALYQEIQQATCNDRPELCVEAGLNMRQMGGDFVKAMWRWGKSGFPTVSEEIFNERKATCLACDQWHGYKDFGLGYCGKCGCATGSVSVKQYMATEQCPKGKWRR